MSKKLLGHFDLHNNSEEDVVDDILNALDEEGFFDEEAGAQDEIEETEEK